MKQIHFTLYALSLFFCHALVAQRICSVPTLQQKIFIEDAVIQWQKKNPDYQQRAVDTIPVVIHVVYKTSAQNISDAIVKSQIDILNEDYNRTNTDASNTPAGFSSLAGSMNIWFKLAVVDPNGNPTTGITRTSTTTTSFGMDDNVKYTSLGGHDAWDPAHYLNLWSCNLSGGTLGYAQFPGGAMATDGVVIGYKYFGRNNPQSPAAFNKGRTATHEVGHYLGLYHIWGDDGTACNGSDNISDTPNQAGENYYCPAFPHTDACNNTANGVMFMNYMDYVDDGCMNMFTKGQVSKMVAVLGSIRPNLPNSYALGHTTSISKQYNAVTFVLAPNPANDFVSLSFSSPKAENISIKILDLQGKEYQSLSFLAQIGENKLNLPLATLAKGLYLVQMRNNTGLSHQKLMIE